MVFPPRISTFLVFSAFVALVHGQMPLPDWNEDDWKLREFVDPQLGGSLFPGTLYSPETDIEGTLNSSDQITTEPDIVPLEALKDLPDDLLASYFPERLDKRLLDPQELMTQTRRDGVKHFLNYHFREARSAIHLLILKPNQRIPSKIDLQDIHQKWFGDSLSVLVVYNFGNPTMSRLVFGAKTQALVAEATLSVTCIESINEAVIAANAEDQLERFLTELSRRLYWIEDAFLGEQPRPARTNTADQLEPGVPVPPRTPRILLTAFFVTALLGGVAVVIIGLQRRASKKTYYFPNRRIYPRLGGPYGGGNRLVVSFDDREAPPHH